MAESARLHIELQSDEILVTLPGTSYSVVYFRRRGSPGLLAKDIVSKNDPRVPQMTVSQFLRQAERLAKDKARELGWIV
jgi:hypothetical protein